MPADALAVHGLTAEFLADNPLFGAVADEFRAASSRTLLFRARPPPTVPSRRANAHPINNECQQTIFAPMRRYYHIPPAPDLREDL